MGSRQWAVGSRQFVKMVAIVQANCLLPTAYCPLPTFFIKIEKNIERFASPVVLLLTKFVEGRMPDVCPDIWANI
jgi:hypothetical protein